VGSLAEPETTAHRRTVRARPTWSTPRQAVTLFLRGSTVVVAGRVAVVVGTILSAANQGSVITAGHANWATWVRVAVNYLTPFVVASLGYLAGCRVDATLPSSATGSGVAGRIDDADRVPGA
jgi:hypothetical protein